MTTLKDHERRITALEGQYGDIKETLASHSESLYDLKRAAVRTELRFDILFKRFDILYKHFNILFKHFNIEDVPDEQVDEVLDAE